MDLTWAASWSGTLSMAVVATVSAVESSIESASASLVLVGTGIVLISQRGRPDRTGNVAPRRETHVDDLRMMYARLLNY